ncbi:MAG: minichromosome maintenance protein MCM [Thaumarchaeota archaeon]|nr:minichromosome maintenance protein MCM [Nitrososphaerota archaeon]
MTEVAVQSGSFEIFLKSFRDSAGNYKYRDRVSQMVATNSNSLVVDFDDISMENTELAESIIKEPDTSLPKFDDALYQVLYTENPRYAENIRNHQHVRIRALPDRVPLRQITSTHLLKMISVVGMVVRTSELKPFATDAGFACKLGHITKVPQSGLLLKKPSKCGEPGCEETKSFELSEKETEFIDFQIIRIQELPEELPAGQLPQSFDVNLSGDLVNTARPGDRITLNGIIRTEPEFTQAGKLRLFRSRIDANYIETMGKGPAEKVEITKEDEALIKSIAAMPNAYERLIESVAPSIHGADTLKEAVLLMITGAQQRNLPDGTTIRGDINVLLVGDPGTAKSELLKYAARIAPRGLYTSGRGSTAAGLTAAVVREKSGMMMLEAGALVLADQGIAAIDEFDKMRTEDRSSLHEAMEQQTVSVAKGGIVATLNARTAILAAANPLLGKYDAYRNIADNINLPIPLLTRFDLIFIIRDIPDRTRDEQLAKHVLAQHRKGTFVTPPPIDFELLRKYLIYAKHIDPVLTKDAEDRVLEYYLQMRGTASEDMITVTPRQLEALIRLATARARVLLRDKVTEDDALHAVNIVRKMLEAVGVDVKTQKIDLGVLHGKPVSERNLITLAFDIFRKLEGPKKEPVSRKAFIEELTGTGKCTPEEAEKILQNLNRDGRIYQVKTAGKDVFYRML